MNDDDLGTPAFELSAVSTALVLLDLQEVCLGWLDAAQRDALLIHVARLEAWARKKGILVVHVGVGFRSGYPEVNPSNRLFSQLAANGLFPGSGAGCGFHPEIGPLAGEPIVTKHRVGAFTGTDLEMILRARGVKTLILAGVTSSGAVLSTVRQASDLDYEVIVAGDCCADPDLHLHALVMDKMMAPHANVVNVAGLESVVLR